MNRETFREAIRPLSPTEEELRANRSSSNRINPAIPQHYVRDREGYYFLSNKIMSQMPTEENTLHTLLKHTILGNKLRLIIHSRFSKIPFHTDEFISVNYVYSGHLSLSFPTGELQILNAGQFYLMNANVVHSFEISSEEDIVFGLQIEREFLNQELLFGLSGNGAVVEFLLKTMLGQETEFSYLIANYAEDDRMRNLFEDIFCEYLDPSYCSEKLVEDYMKVFFILLIRADADVVKINTKADVLRILEYINQNYADCSLRALSEEFHFSEKYLSRLIHEKTGMTYMEILSEAKMNAVTYYLLNTELPIHDIAVQCGYANQSFFYKKFSERYGISPSKFRNAARSSE